MTEAVLLFSGGLDSTVLLAWALDKKIDFRVLEFEYEGRPRGEREAARKILNNYSINDVIRVQVPTIDGKLWPRDTKHAQGYFPLRNLWFHATASLVAKQLRATRILAGHLGSDSEEFPDARADYFARIEALVNAGGLPKEPAMAIDLPFHGRRKRDIAALGGLLRAPLGSVWACYGDQAESCGKCSGCKELDAAFTQDASPAPRRP